MNLGQLVNSILYREQKYEDVKVEYSDSGSFILSAERNGDRYKYVSHADYSVYSSSPLLGLFSKRLGGLMEEKRVGSGIIVICPEKNELTYIIYDRKNHTIHVGVEKESQFTEISKSDHQIICNDPLMSDKTASKILSRYLSIFRHQKRLFNVRYYQKKALGKTLQAYSI